MVEKYCFGLKVWFCGSLERVNAKIWTHKRDFTFEISCHSGFLMTGGGREASLSLSERIERGNTKKWEEDGVRKKKGKSF